MNSSIKGFMSYLVSKGWKVTFKNDYLIVKVRFAVYYVSIRDVGDKIVISFNNVNYMIYVYSNTSYEIADSCCTYLFSRNCGVSLYENLYKLFSFCFGYTSVILLEVCYLIELNSEKSGENWAKGMGFPCGVTNNYPTIEMFGKHVGYRIKIQTSLTSLSRSEVDYDISLNLAEDCLNKFLVADRRFLIPVYFTNGLYRNPNDFRLHNVRQVTSKKNLREIIKEL